MVEFDSIELFEWHDEDWADVNNAPGVNITSSRNPSAYIRHQMDGADMKILLMHFGVLKAITKPGARLKKTIIVGKPFGMHRLLVFHMQIHARPKERLQLRHDFGSTAAKMEAREAV